MTINVRTEDFIHFQLMNPKVNIGKTYNPELVDVILAPFVNKEQPEPITHALNLIGLYETHSHVQQQIDQLEKPGFHSYTQISNLFQVITGAIVIVGIALCILGNHLLMIPLLLTGAAILALSLLTLMIGNCTISALNHRLGAALIQIFPLMGSIIQVIDANFIYPKQLRDAKNTYFDEIKGGGKVFDAREQVDDAGDEILAWVNEQRVDAFASLNDNRLVIGTDRENKRANKTMVLAANTIRKLSRFRDAVNRAMDQEDFLHELDPLD